MRCSDDSNIQASGELLILAHDPGQMGIDPSEIGSESRLCNGSMVH
jgi:hypothetical protein